MILAKNPYSLLLAIGIIASWFLQASLAQELDLVNITTSYDLASIFEEAGEGSIGLHRLGALKFLEFDDGKEYLCAVVNAEKNNAAVYCLDVVRDPANGKLTGLTYDEMGPIGIETPSGETALKYPQLSNSFTPGPGGYDYMVIDDYMGLPDITWILLMEWTRALGGRPKLNVIHRTDVSLDLQSISFSNIVKDSGTNFGMMFGAVSSGEMVEIPLLPSSDVFDVDNSNIRYVCTGKVSTFESFGPITTGFYTNDFVAADFDRKRIVVLDVDDSSGYPEGVFNTRPYFGVTEYAEYFNVECQIQEFIITDPYNPWGAVFDGKTGDYLFSNFDPSEDKNAILYQVGTEGGFAPGFDSAVVEANLVSVFKDLVALSNGGKRKDGQHLRHLPANKSNPDKEPDVQCEFATNGELVHCRRAIRGVRQLLKSRDWTKSVTAGEASPAVISLADALADALEDAKQSFRLGPSVEEHTRFGLCLLDIVRNMGDPENTPSCSVP